MWVAVTCLIVGVLDLLMKGGYDSDNEGLRAAVLRKMREKERSGEDGEL